MYKSKYKTSAAVLALFLSSVHGETVHEKTLTDNSMSANQKVDLVTNQEVMLESFVDGTESAVE